MHQKLGEDRKGNVGTQVAAMKKTTKAALGRGEASAGTGGEGRRQRTQEI